MIEKTLSRLAAPAILVTGAVHPTLTAFFISVYHGLFGFIHRPHGTPQAVAGIAEVAAIVLLGAARVVPRAGAVFSRPARA